MTTPVSDQISGQWTCRHGARPEAAIAYRGAAPARRHASTGALLDALSAFRYDAHLAALTRPASRLSTSTGYSEAARHVHEHLGAAGYTVTTTPVSVGNGLSHNIFGELAGGDPGRGAVVVCAHLDSVNHQDGPAGAAPGADDNASGAAGALELATVLAAHRWRHDLRVILFGGEEQGLLGSKAYLAGLDADERARIRAVLNMDMIGRRNGAAPGVLIEGADVSRALIDQLATAAASWTDLQVFTSLNPFASDHVPFIDAGIPAVLTIEADDSANTAVHTAADVINLLDTALATDILRMNLAVLHELLGGASEH